MKILFNICFLLLLSGCSTFENKQEEQNLVKEKVIDYFIENSHQVLFFDSTKFILNQFELSHCQSLNLDIKNDTIFSTINPNFTYYSQENLTNIVQIESLVLTNDTTTTFSYDTTNLNYSISKYCGYRINRDAIKDNTSNDYLLMGIPILNQTKNKAIICSNRFTGQGEINYFMVLERKNGVWGIIFNEVTVGTYSEPEYDGDYETTYLLYTGHYILKNE